MHFRLILVGMRGMSAIGILIFTSLGTAGCAVSGHAVQDRQFRKDPPIGTVVRIGDSVSKIASARGCVVVLVGDCAACTVSSLRPKEYSSQLPLVFLVTGSDKEIPLWIRHSVDPSRNTYVVAVDGSLVRDLNPVIYPRAYQLDSKLRLTWLGKRSDELPAGVERQQQ